MTNAHSSTVSPARGLAADLVIPLFGLLAALAFPTQHAFLAQIAIMALLVLSLDLVVGYAGLATLGHVAMYGAGAYGAGLYALHLSPEPLSGLVIGALAGGIVALASALLLMRTHGLTFLMLTVAVTQILYELASRNRAITGGDDGLYGIDPLPVLGLFKFDFLGVTSFWYALAILSLVFAALRRVMRAPFGQVVQAVRDDAGRVTSLGGRVYRHRVAIYTLSGAIAGIAGALTAQTTQVVGLNTLGVTMSADILVMLVLGGTGRLWGALIGTVAFMIIHHYAAVFDPTSWMLIIGLILIATVLFLPGGMLRGLELLAGLFGKWRRA